ncbi:unnamed protein product [Nippostrongylus brasiliensis]|uniref:Cation diffusion facilitator family protein 1 (inferred by orthology to a C. elegans protein) n=1 Tax=Nippostrongylus brasiliensis TaxID=27835 RepID=A0A0N4XD73_NIPBR|nr:unnamed protein product [Nippostrongylus brasiliensis]
MSQIETHSECGAEADSKANDVFSQNSKKVLVMISITFLFFFVELVVGFMNRSIALLADSYHMLSDVMALVIAFVCLRVLIVGCIGLLINIVGIGMFHSGHGHSHGGGGHSHGEKAGKQKEQKDACAEGTEKMLYAPNDDDYEELDSDSNAAPVNRPVRSRSRVGQECSHNVRQSILISSFTLISSEVFICNFVYLIVLQVL